MRPLSGSTASTGVVRRAAAAILLLWLSALGGTSRKHQRPRHLRWKGRLSHRPGRSDRQPSHVDRLRTQFVRTRWNLAKWAAWGADPPDPDRLWTAGPSPAPCHLGLRLPPHLRPGIAVRFGCPGCLRGFTSVEPPRKRAGVLRSGGRAPHGLQRGQGADSPSPRTSPFGDSPSEQHLRNRPAYRTTRHSGFHCGNQHGRPGASAARRARPGRWRGDPGRRFCAGDTAHRRTRTDRPTGGGSRHGGRLQRGCRTHHPEPDLRPYPRDRCPNPAGGRIPSHASFQ